MLLHAAADTKFTGPFCVPPPGRKGYLFREGSLGAGYYRKDVVRRYCPTAAPPTPGSSIAAAATVPDAEQGRDGEARRMADQQQQNPEGELARQYIRRLLAAPPSMHSVVLSPCGSLLFTSSLGPKDCAIRVWRLLPGGRSITAGRNGSQHSSDGGAALQPELHRTLTGHAAPVLSLALTPDGSLLLSGSHDQTVRVWRTSDWHCLRVLKGHGGGVRALVVAPDARTLYSAAADNTVRVSGCTEGVGCGGGKAGA